MSALGYADARHLLARTGFGPTDAEVRAFAGLDRHEAVARLLKGVRTVAITPPPAWVNDAFERAGGGLKDAPPAVKHAFGGELRERGLELRAWWYREMLVTPSPLTEKLVLFWHNHFVSSQQKVRSNLLMYRQNLLLRRHVAGSFRTLLHEVARDPAMLVYLDGAASRREQPNENFAREVMELFTLGEGHYAEADIKEAARAFTGWSIDRDTGEYMFRPRLHDDGDKQVLGARGALDGDAVLEVLLAQDALAPFLVRKLWRAFVSPTPDEAEVTRLAAIFRRADLALAPLLAALFTSDAFYRAEHRASLVKSPVELLVGTLRQLDDTPEEPPTDLRDAVLAGAALGQNLFAPPNVKGWPGGQAWIDASTLLARKQLLSRLLRGVEPAFVASLPGDDDARSKQLARLLLPAPPHHAVEPGTPAMTALERLVLDPVYQLT